MKEKKNPYNALAIQQKVFVKAVVDGMAPREACKKAWPSCDTGNRDLDVRLATVMSNEKIKAAIHWFTSHRDNPDVLRAQLSLIMADPNVKPSERLKAIGMLSKLGEKPDEEAPKNKKQVQENLQDQALKRKIDDITEKVLGKPN
jgi:hypothetical protein